MSDVIIDKHMTDEMVNDHLVDRKSDHEDRNKCSARKTLREDRLKENLLRRLKRVEGQVRGIGGMVERDVYCDDVLHQIAAVRSALKSISHLVMEDHIHGCLVDRIRDGDDDVVDELLVTIGKLL